ncbi:hypothetical protein KUCAC02_035038 [Chaenocephalus aceratus]|nr:hypothetical protein KUCAC02_035038 [Chaenocephalus aceratus]
MQEAYTQRRTLKTPRERSRGTADGQDPAELPDLNDPLVDHSAGQLFLSEAFKIILQEVLCKGTDVKQKVCEWREPGHLALLLDVELRAAGEPQQRLLQRVQDVAKYSIKTSHPRFFNQLCRSGLSRPGWTIPQRGAQHQPLYYEVAPVLVLIEAEVLRSLRQLIGWTKVKSQGLWAVPRLAIFTSAESHYSVKKGAAYLGIGTDNIVVVKVDEGGRLIPEDLEEKIELTKSQGAVPLLVSCTSGTTVRGAFDPLDRVADVCEETRRLDARRREWSERDGLESAAWGRERAVLRAAQTSDGRGCQSKFSSLESTQAADGRPAVLCLAAAGYNELVENVPTQDKFYDFNLDVGDKTIQCGRKDDCLKLWLMWKAVGSIGLAERVDKAFNLVRYLVEQMRKREGFHLLWEPEFLNVCFWFIPPSMRGEEGHADYQDRLANVAPVVKERMIKQGTMMVGYQPLGDKVNFFRMIVLSTLVSKEDMDFFLDEIERLGNDL